MPGARRIVLRLLAIASAALLVACADVAVRGEQGLPLIQFHARVPPEQVAALQAARPCCASLAELPFAALGADKLTLDLDARSPAFAFDSGKSFFAAFRLPDGPRPLEVRVTSRVHALTPAIAAANRTIFNPALAVLDSQHRVRALLHEPGAFTVGPAAYKDAGVEVTGTVYIDGPPEDSAFLVVLTTDALRARRGDARGVILEGFSPVGIVDLEMRAASFIRPPVSFRSGAALAAPDGSAPLSATGVLFVDRAGVHYVDDKERRYIERAFVPFERMVSARFEPRFMSGDRLVLDVAEGSGAPMSTRSFALWPERGQPLAGLRDVEKSVAAGIPPGWYREAVAIEAGTSAPEVVFRDPPGAAATAGGRIAEGAMTGGMLTAGVCGLCYGGVCPPEVLLSCAGLFAVGAAIGGVASIGGELVSGANRAPTPRLPAAQVEAGAPAVRSQTQALLAQDALRQCVVKRITSDAVWVEQGRAATVVPNASDARFVVRTSVERVALVGEGKPGDAAAAMPVRLVVDGTVTLSDTARRREERRSASWQGPTYTLTEWTAPDGRALQSALAQACDGLAARMLAASSSWWRGAR